MNIKISPTEYERCYPKRLKRLFETHINLRTYNEFIPEMERAVVGNIPIEVIKMLPKSNKGEKIKAFQDALSKTTLKLRKKFHTLRFQADDFSLYDKNYRPSTYAKEIAQEGEKTLNKELIKIFGENYMRAKVEYINHGSFGNIFRFALFDKNGDRIMHDKALKVYHQVSEGDPYYSKSHNTHAEANFWTFLKRAVGHKLDNTQFTKHYISDLHSGYCLTEFVDEKIPKTKTVIPIYKLFAFHIPEDSKNNMKIMGKVFDGGGYEINKNFTADKIILRYLKQLYNHTGKEFEQILKNLTKLIENPKTPQREKIEKAIEIYNSYK